MTFLERLQQPKPMLMGILNVTPDSFSDGGRYVTEAAATRQALAMAGAGAEIIDVGGESTRPGSDRVAARVQIERVAPVIHALKRSLPAHCFISIDTSLSEVAEAAIDAGADFVNDVSAGRDDPAMFDMVARRGVAIVLMHMQGTPKTMQEAPSYQDVVAEVRGFLLQRAEVAGRAGIPRESIVLDPGIGFGKRKIDNLRLMAHLEDFVSTGFSLLLGASRKRFMGAILQVREPTELVAATVATTTLGVMAGVKIFRVHDVAENRQALEVAWAIRQTR